ncbi:hypothetical protein BV20DRAFT_702200 [Pilatotrama ljubarskyi]|nr:hypothetical protein BV20DRAFT_702200 [Pilatotrama ljubarskyi]
MLQHHRVAPHVPHGRRQPRRVRDEISAPRRPGILSCVRLRGVRPRERARARTRRGGQLADPSKPGYRKILCFFLVEPLTKILSTSDVPPQQEAWLVDAAMGIPALSSASGRTLGHDL